MVFTHALITRPRPQCQELAGWLASEHLSPIVSPAFAFEAVDEPVRGDEAWARAKTRLLLFTSTRAVDFGLPALEGRLLWGARIASIGPATTRALSAAGLDALQSAEPPFDSEHLLEMLDEQLDAAGTPGAAIILAAPGGREALQSGLEARGWSVRLAEVYRRVPLDPDPEGLATLEAMGTEDRLLSIWTSANAMEQLFACLSEKVLRKMRTGTAIVISERLAEAARASGVSDVHVTEGPSNGDIVKCYHLLAH